MFVMLKEASSGSAMANNVRPSNRLCIRRYQYNALLTIKPCAGAVLSAAAMTGRCARPGVVAAMARKIVVQHIRCIIAIADVVRIVHLHKNTARLCGNLKQAVLQIVMLLTSLAAEIFPERHRQ